MNSLTLISSDCDSDDEGGTCARGCVAIGTIVANSTMFGGAPPDQSLPWSLESFWEPWPRLVSPPALERKRLGLPSRGSAAHHSLFGKALHRGLLHNGPTDAPRAPRPNSYPSEGLKNARPQPAENACQ